MVCFKHYYFKKWFSSSYVETAMKIAIRWKDVHN